jgi:hypothetical protein
LSQRRKEHTLIITAYLNNKCMQFLLRFLLDLVSIKRETQPFFLEYNLVQYLR